MTFLNENSKFPGGGREEVWLNKVFMWLTYWMCIPLELEAAYIAEWNILRNFKS